MATLSRQELIRLARTGAAARLRELRQEMDALLRSFPELRRPGGSPPRRSRRRAQASERTTRRRTRRGWTAAQRKAVSDRMKKYWVARKASQKKS